MKKGKGSISNLFTGWFEDPREKDSKENKATGPSRDESTVVRSNKIDLSQSVGPVSVDQEYVEHMIKLLEDKNLDGIDMFEFMKAVRANIQSGVSADVAYSSAFRSLNSVDASLSVGRLTETADFYIGVINKELEDFTQEANSLAQQTSDSSNSEISNLETRNDEIQSSITRLQEELVRNRERITALGAESAQVVNEQRIRVSRMSGAKEHVVSVITRDLDGLKTYVK